MSSTSTSSALRAGVYMPKRVGTKRKVDIEKYKHLVSVGWMKPDDDTLHRQLVREGKVSEEIPYYAILPQPYDEKYMVKLEYFYTQEYTLLSKSKRYNRTKAIEYNRYLKKLIRYREILRRFKLNLDRDNPEDVGCQKHIFYQEYEMNIFLSVLNQFSTVLERDATSPDGKVKDTVQDAKMKLKRLTKSVCDELNKIDKLLSKLPLEIQRECLEEEELKFPKYGKYTDIPEDLKCRKPGTLFAYFQ